VRIPAQPRRSSRVNGLRLLYLGRLDPIKGIENLLEACAIVQRGGAVRVHLTIAGDGHTAYVDVLRRRITALELSGVVTMHGWADDDEKERLFTQCDILVAPSYRESFAIVVAEALSHQVPVIASQGTPWRRIDEEGCGMWVTNDSKNLAETIIRASAMPLEEMGRRGREWMVREFDWSRVATRMRMVYRDLAGAAQPSDNVTGGGSGCRHVPSRP
jgi:glycosyltransferase involved in cell wall biosynthesis